MNSRKKLSTVRINQILANAKASLAVEDLHPSEETIKITRAYLAGSITDEEGLQAIRNKIENSNRLEE